jgi:hypothetical protein
MTEEERLARAGIEKTLAASPSKGCRPRLRRRSCDSRRRAQPTPGAGRGGACVRAECAIRAAGRRRGRRQAQGCAGLRRTGITDREMRTRVIVVIAIAQVHPCLLSRYASIGASALL